MLYFSLVLFVEMKTFEANIDNFHKMSNNYKYADELWNNIHLIII